MILILSLILFLGSVRGNLRQYQFGAYHGGGYNVVSSSNPITLAIGSLFVYFIFLYFIS